MLGSEGSGINPEAFPVYRGSLRHIIVAMAGFWGRRKRVEQEQREAADNDLALRARTAIVAADERIRVTGDELSFAAAELGDAATEPLRVGLESVKTHLAEAFKLHQLNHDEVPDTVEELRTRNERIVQLCEWAEDVLDERTGALKTQIERVREAPAISQRLRDEIASMRARLPEVREAVTRLSERFSAEALGRLRLTVSETEELLGFAERSIDLSERRRESKRVEDANLALETATETVRRAASMIDGVDSFEIEAIRTRATLAEVIEDSRGDLVAAAHVPQTEEITEAARLLEAELVAVNSAGEQSDPFAALSSLSAANAALDRAVAVERERAQRFVPGLEHVQHDVRVADHALGVADRLINGHRGWIGADARTRFAEASRSRAEITEAMVASDDTREEAQRLAREATQRAEEATRLAQRDIDSSRPDGDERWDRGGRGGGAGVLGPVLGGMLLGSILDDIFD